MSSVLELGRKTRRNRAGNRELILSHLGQIQGPLASEFDVTFKMLSKWGGSMLDIAGAIRLKFFKISNKHERRAQLLAIVSFVLMHSPLKVTRFNSMELSRRYQRGRIDAGHCTAQII